MTDDAYRKIRVAALVEMARGLCAMPVEGVTRPGCFCGGDAQRCHASRLYGDFAIAALLALERGGYAVIKLPGIADLDAVEVPLEEVPA